MCFSLTKCAKDVIAIFLRGVAGVTLCWGLSAYHSIRLAVASKFLKTPASSRGVSFAVLYHDAGESSCPFICPSFAVGVIFRFKEVVHKNRPLRKTAGTVSFHSFFIRIDVLDAPDFFIGGALWANDCGFHMRPPAVAPRIWNSVVRLGPRR